MRFNWLLFLFLFSFSFAQCDLQTIALENVPIGVALSLAISILALAYMASSVFYIPQARAYVSSELFNIIFTVIIVLSFSYLYLAMCSIFNLVSDSNNLEQKYLSISSDATSVLSLFLDKYITWLRDSRILKTYYFVLEGSSTVGVTVYKAAYAIQYDILNNLVVVPSLVSINIQYFIIKYAPLFSMEYILPVGILLRLFSPTRDIGNVFIAIGFAGSFIIPVLYSFAADSYLSIKDKAKQYPFVSDEIFGEAGKGIGFWEVGSLAVISVFLPTLVLVILAVFLTGFYSFLKGVG